MALKITSLLIIFFNEMHEIITKMENYNLD
jgi:hypothetical protein